MNSQILRLFTSTETQPTAALVLSVITDRDLWCLENNAPPQPRESQGEQGEAPVWMQALGKEDRSLLIHRKSKGQTLNENLEITSNYKQALAK